MGTDDARKDQAVGNWRKRMTTGSPDDPTDHEVGGSDTVLPQHGSSPYATGGGGVTFERKVAVQYLARLLTGDGASELGDGRCVVGVEFQQAPTFPVDDIVVKAACPSDTVPPLVLALGIRRAPKIVKSNASTRKLLGQYVRAAIAGTPDGHELLLGLVVAGPRPHAEQLALLATDAAAQSTSTAFFDLVQTPDKYKSPLRRRLGHLEQLVELVLQDLGVKGVDAQMVRQRTWQLLSKLKVLMPRLEPPDETDWAGVVNGLKAVVPNADLAAAASIRDRLVALADDYAPKAATVNRVMLRRALHAAGGVTTGRLQCRQTLDSLDQLARKSVCMEIAEADGDRSIQLDREAAARALLEAVSGADAVLVTGESGVGKSALAVMGLAAIGDAEKDRFQMVCINLRQVPELPSSLEADLGAPLSTLLAELSAPLRALVIDGADAATEGRADVLRYLSCAAADSQVKVVAVAPNDSSTVVRDLITKSAKTRAVDHVVPPLDDSDIAKVVDTFPELRHIRANPRSRELLRRLVVADLLVRGGVAGTPLTETDAMNEVWDGLVRRREMSDRGLPDARATALLRVAECELGIGSSLDVVKEIDSSALEGLRRDGLLRKGAFYNVGPEFAHDEIRRYAVARLLLADGDPVSRLREAHVPRWTLAAARLACQAWLAQKETPSAPLEGRLSEQQASFDALVQEGYGSRWGDVPSEALLFLADSEPVLRDAWPDLLADNAAGLRRLARVVDQRLRDANNVVDIAAVAPVIALLLETSTPWRERDYIKKLLRAWLIGHVRGRTPMGHPLRIRLRKLIVEQCDTAKRRLAEQQKEIDVGQHGQQIIHPSSIPFARNPRRQRRPLPMVLTDESTLETLALLGPDLGGDGESVLRQVAKDAPQHLGPAVDGHSVGLALSCRPGGLLATLTEAYYLDDGVDKSSAFGEGVRDHLWAGLGALHAAWYRGPFVALFWTDFRRGVATLNRLLNHAALVRVRQVTNPDDSQDFRKASLGSSSKCELSISGVQRSYVGDHDVWRWYRGNADGPYPCISALQALEHVCDELIAHDFPIKDLVSFLLEDCKSLAMVGFVVGMLVRHIENIDDLLDPYFAEPLIWQLEFGRVAAEYISSSFSFSESSPKLRATDRRRWSLRDAGVFLVMKADEERTKSLRTLGHTLVANARRLQLSAGYLMQVRAWASSLDRGRHTPRRNASGHVLIEVSPTDDVVRALSPRREATELGSECFRLVSRYAPGKDKGIAPDELIEDVSAIRAILESSASTTALYNPWEAASLISTAVLEAFVLKNADLSDEVLSFAATIPMEVGEGVEGRKQYGFDNASHPIGADRSAARAVPLLLLPQAAHVLDLIGSDGELSAVDRVVRASVHLARAEAYEARLFFARSLDHLWKVPCAGSGRCHHEKGWKMVKELMRRCVIGPYDSKIGRRRAISLGEPFVEALGRVGAESILATHLDPAIRALAPAAMGSICVSVRAQGLLLALLEAQRRSLLQSERVGVDSRGTHALVAARALLTLASEGHDLPAYQHIDAYADKPSLLGGALRALSAVAEEDPNMAATARRIWPSLVDHVLSLHQSGHHLADGRYYGENALAALVPSPAEGFRYLYREIAGSANVWWKGLRFEMEMEAWLPNVRGDATCADRLIGFVRTMGADDQIRLGLPWVSEVVRPDPVSIVNGAFRVADWLIEIRADAAGRGALGGWQEVVDALVVAGSIQLASYSD